MNEVLRSPISVCREWLNGWSPITRTLEHGEKLKMCETCGKLVALLESLNNEQRFCLCDWYKLERLSSEMVKKAAHQGTTVFWNNPFMKGSPNFENKFFFLQHNKNHESLSIHLSYQVIYLGRWISISIKKVLSENIWKSDFFVWQLE